jgi:DNA-binding NarL/FixJ family response regulator
LAESAARRAGERIVRLSRGCDNSRSLRTVLLDEIRRSVEFDAYAWLLTDPESEVGSDPLADVPCLHELPKLIRLKYSTEVNRWTHLKAPLGRLWADTGGRPERSLVWRELLCTYNVKDVASMAFRDRFGCWGFLDLWRVGTDRHFDDQDAAYLTAIAPQVTDALRRAQAHTFQARPAREVHKGPLVLVLAPNLELRAQTAETEPYLRALVPTEADRGIIPAGAYNVGAQLLASEAGVDTHLARARVHLGGGTWLSFRAARMAGNDQPDGNIAVTIEAVYPPERLSLYCRAHGLTRRETELVTALAGGSDTRQLARDLHVSENTVQDHLKAIFAKTETGNRRTLMAQAVGT